MNLPPLRAGASRRGNVIYIVPLPIPRRRAGAFAGQAPTIVTQSLAGEGWGEGKYRRREWLRIS